MEAKRLILETDAAGNLKQVPKLPPNQQVEVIVLMLTDAEAVRQTHSTPRSDTANNKLDILGNMTTSASQTEERSRRMKLALLERLNSQLVTGERNWTRSSLYDS